jgi:hypothetical protein
MPLCVMKVKNEITVYKIFCSDIMLCITIHNGIWQVINFYLPNRKYIYTNTRILRFS